MEIINVESRTWEMMMARFEAFAQRVETLCHCTGDKALQKEKYHRQAWGE